MLSKIFKSKSKKKAAPSAKKTTKKPEKKIAKSPKKSPAKEKKKAPVKKALSPPKKPSPKAQEETPRIAPLPSFKPGRMITAEGWKRLMINRSKKK